MLQEYWASTVIFIGIFSDNVQWPQTVHLPYIETHHTRSWNSLLRHDFLLQGQISGYPSPIFEDSLFKEYSLTVLNKTWYTSNRVCMCMFAYVWYTYTREGTHRKLSPKVRIPKIPAKSTEYQFS